MLWQLSYPFNAFILILKKNFQKRNINAASRVRTYTGRPQVQRLNHSAIRRGGQNKVFRRDQRRDGCSWLGFVPFPLISSLIMRFSTALDTYLGFLDPTSDNDQVQRIKIWLPIPADSSPSLQVVLDTPHIDQVLHHYHSSATSKDTTATEHRRTGRSHYEDRLVVLEEQLTQLLNKTEKSKAGTILIWP